MLVYRKKRATNSTVSKLLDSKTNDLTANMTVEQSSSILCCFKRILGRKTEKIMKKSQFESINNKTTATTLTTTATNVSKETTNLIKNNVQTDKDERIQLAPITNCMFVMDNKTNDTEDYGYHSIPQESQLNSQTSLNDSLDESIEAASTMFLSNEEQTCVEESIELFINKLQTLIEVYIRPLIALNILNKNEYLILFQNMEKLVPVTNYLLNVIHTNDFNNGSLKTVFETYETYLCGLPNAIKLLKDLLVNHEEFYLFLKACH